MDVPGRPKSGLARIRRPNQRGGCHSNELNFIDINGQSPQRVNNCRRCDWVNEAYRKRRPPEDQQGAFNEQPAKAGGIS